MLETQAIVISLEGNEAVVEALDNGGCGKCSSEGGCGSGKLSQLFCSTPRRFRVRNDGDAKVGAAVQVSLAEGALLHSALLMYVLPLLLMLAGALLAAFWAAAENADAYSALGAALGLGLGFLLAKMLSLRQRMLSVCRPVICPR